MTATDELRRLLDERGVEWRAYTDLTRGAMEVYHTTYFEMPNRCKARVASIIDTDLVLLTCRTTPEQAIDATLGRGTCRVESMHGYTDPYVATRYVVELSCHTLDDWPESEPPAYCPKCGAKVVGE